ncbi:hypothetical protein AAZX31_12G036600 [Glycine max]
MMKLEVQIPYLIALAVTPPTHSLEGTLLHGSVFNCPPAPSFFQGLPSLCCDLGFIFYSS